MTNNHLLYLFTRTPLHVGAGSSVGAVDQPIQRERHTRFPLIPGSSLKGVLRDHFAMEQAFSPEGVETLFGDEDASNAGIVSFSEAKILAFPLRSAKGSFALVTCPLVLRRLIREHPALQKFTIPEIEDGTCLSGPAITLHEGSEKCVVLEEYVFIVRDDFPAEWTTKLSTVLDDAVLEGAKNRWVLLSDGDFSHFVETATQVHQHVRISDETGTVDGSGLFNEETVPSEALFYAVLTPLPRPGNENHIPTIESAFQILKSEQVIQFGGKGTTGLGYCSVRLTETSNF